MTTEIIHNSFTDPLEESGFQLRRGWDATLADGLVAGAREPAMQAAVPRDMNERFADDEAATRWHDKDPERVIYALAHHAMIAGVIWFSYQPRPQHDADYTLAIRLYDAARGKGLAGDFLEAAHMDFGSETVWLETDATNTRAVNLYLAHGYREVERVDDRVMMVRPSSRSTL